MWNSTAIYWPNTLSDLLGHFFWNGKRKNLFPADSNWLSLSRQWQHLSWAGISRSPRTRLPPSFRPATTHGDNGWVSWLCFEQILWLHLFRWQFPVTSYQQPAVLGLAACFSDPQIHKLFPVCIRLSICVFVRQFVVAKLAAIRPNRACSAWLAGMDFPQLHWSGIPLWRLKLLDYFCWPSVGKSTLASYLPIIDVCRLSEIPVKTLALIKLLLSRLYFGVTQMIMYLCFQMETAVQLIWKLFG